jgi:hypothetical protein
MYCWGICLEIQMKTTRHVSENDFSEAGIWCLPNIQVLVNNKPTCSSNDVLALKYVPVVKEVEIDSRLLHSILTSLHLCIVYMSCSELKWGFQQKYRRRVPVLRIFTRMNENTFFTRRNEISHEETK